MAVTYGFYNSINHDRVYDSRQMSSIFDGVINDGIYMAIGEKMMVFPSSGMQIAVGSGRAWFNHTWTLNDSRLLLTVEPSDLLYDRIDTVVLEIDEDIRENTIKIIKGTPSNSPVAPTLIETETIHQKPLADIRVNKTSNVITSSNITNRVGFGKTPFVTGIIQTINADFILNRWNNEWNNWKGDFEAWVMSQQDIFNDWFDSLQTNLDGDIAANHERRILALEAGGEPTKIQTTLQAIMWQNKRYSFEARYPASQYDLQVDLNGDVATTSQANAFALAYIAGSITKNEIIAFGDVPTIDIPIVLTVNLRDETYKTDTMLASNWSGNKYSFEATYPITQYDISVEPDGERLNKDILKAWSKALIFGQVSENKAVAYGKIPSINIPIIVKVVKK